MQLGTERSVLRPQGSATGCRGIGIRGPGLECRFQIGRAGTPRVFSRRPSGIKRVSERWAHAGGAAASENGAAALNVAEWRRECAAGSTDSAAGGPEKRAAESAISGATAGPARRGLRNPPVRTRTGINKTTRRIGGRPRSPSHPPAVCPEIAPSTAATGRQHLPSVADTLRVVHFIVVGAPPVRFPTPHPSFDRCHCSPSVDSGLGKQMHHICSKRRHATISIRVISAINVLGGYPLSPQPLGY